MLSVRGLTVRYGAVVSLNDVSFEFPTATTCGLIGPNGAGKTTFLNTVSGFSKPAAGAITAFGEELGPMSGYQRARWGLRRTFQTEQTIHKLTVYDNVAMVHEHSRSRRANRRAAVRDALDFVGLGGMGDTAVGELDAGNRRMVEIARAVVGEPQLILMDEPAAGLPDNETARLSEIIRAIPERTGALTVLVDHDMDLVTSCCSITAVLDFGSLLAIGATAEVLADTRVAKAYLGEEIDEEEEQTS